MKKNIKKIAFIILLILIVAWFYKINELNYKKITDIKRNIVNHPENLPKKETAMQTAFWFKNLRADLYRLETIQYIWWNVIGSEYKKYLFIILDLITELNPYFEHPYIIWQLLLPDYNQRYEELSKKEQEKYIDQGVEIWLKWIKNFCPDNEKIKLINSESDLNIILTEEKYKNPCKTYTIPYYLAYVYYFYKKDAKTASDYYKIATANDDAPAWARIMAAIMQWKWWNREKSYFMFLNLAKLVDSKDEVCLEFSTKLEEVWVWLFFNKQIKLDWKIIKDIEDLRNKIFWKFDEKEEEKFISDMNCWNYVNKAVRELNLAYIEEANERYKKDNAWESAANQKELFEKWYIDFSPTDFQQYEKYWIIYKYNDEIWNFDYSMENY